MIRWNSAKHFAALTAFVGLLACDDPGGVGCTAEFRMIRLVITDKAGSPADSVDFTVRLVRTGEVLNHTTPGPNPTGTYLLIDDGATTKLQPTGEQVRAVAIRGPAAAQADFLIGVPGGCHVQKVSGPDTLALP
jgi:hypothetical protein